MSSLSCSARFFCCRCKALVAMTLFVSLAVATLVSIQLLQPSRRGDCPQI